MPPDIEGEPAPDLSRALIVAPLRKDSAYIAGLLERHSIPCQICHDQKALEAFLAGMPAMLIATHESLTDPVLECVADHLRKQPAWSELPIIVLLDKTSGSRKIHSVLEAKWPRSRLVFYHRPVATLELVSGVQSLLLARIRQREVRDHLDREVELRRELNHRVKNILASVLSILQLTRRSTHSIDQFVNDFEGRLKALAEVHSAVFRAGGETVELADIVRTTVAPYSAAAGDDRISVEGPPLTIGREAGTSLALSLHELVTNAIKYGALSSSGGNVVLRWRVGKGTSPEFEMEWLENGGPPVRAPDRIGYGTRYLRAGLTSLLGNEPVIEYHETGLRFRVSGPLKRLSEERQ